jgi:hypothetical protein
MVLAALGCALPACKDTTRFTTAPGESYCGSIVQGPFVRAGFKPDVQLRMSFDADALASAPGALTTSDGLLTEAPLRAIPQLFHDPLSQLEFGEGRQRNLLYVVDPSDPARGSSVTTVVSLMDNGDVELRLVRGAPSPEGATPSAENPQLFGVFHLHRAQGACF